jgi:hypothetical protein
VGNIENVKLQAPYLMMRHKAAVHEQAEGDVGNQALHVIGLWTAQDESRQRLKSAISNAMKITRDRGEALMDGGAPASSATAAGAAAGAAAVGGAGGGSRGGGTAAHGHDSATGSPLRSVNVFSFSETDANTDANTNADTATPVTPTQSVVAAGTSAQAKLLSPSEMRKITAQKVAAAAAVTS